MQGEVWMQYEEILIRCKPFEIILLESILHMLAVWSVTSLTS